MPELVLELGLQGPKDKQKAMSKVSGIKGVGSVAIETKEKKMTVTGEFDAVHVTSKLRKICNANIVTLGEAKEKKKDDKKSDTAEWEQLYRLYNPYICYPVTSVEESPTSCVIC